MDFNDLIKAIPLPPDVAEKIIELANCSTKRLERIKESAEETYKTLGGDELKSELEVLTARHGQVTRSLLEGFQKMLRDNSMSFGGFISEHMDKNLPPDVFEHMVKLIEFSFGVISHGLRAAYKEHQELKGERAKTRESDATLN